MAAGSAPGFSRELSNADLALYLQRRYSSNLHEFVLPHVTGDILYRMKEESMDFARAFPGLGVSDQADLIALECFVAALVRAESAAVKSALKSSESASKKFASAASRQSAAAVPAAAAVARPWSDIVATAAKNDKTQAQKAGLQAAAVAKCDALENGGYTDRPF